MRYSSGRTYSIAVHEDAQADLDHIYEQDEDAAADIEVFLEEARNNQETLDNLTRRGYVKYGDHPFDVKEWERAKRLKYNLWRIRLLWLDGLAAKYRIIYAFHPIEYRYYVLVLLCYKKQGIMRSSSTNLSGARWTRECNGSRTT
jgi:hypothetical protein